MTEIIKCTTDDFAELAAIWERSVRATHGFITENDIAEIRQLLESDYFPNVELFALRDDSSITGFIGLSSNRIEMLFVDSHKIGRGYGTMLIDYAKDKGANEVDVNEQNQTALKFYLNKGFEVISRDETDDAGRPYPILHLRLVRHVRSQ